MAEAAPPRKTTTYNRFSTMASQNERYNTKEDEFFWLENIMRTAPHKLHSVPGPRTVAEFPLPTPPPGCTDVTFRGQAAIIQELAFDLNDPTPGNLHASWGQVTSSGELYAVVGESSCGGGNMNYITFSYPPFNCCEIFHYTDNNSTLNSAIDIVAGDGGSFVNARIINADVPCWAAQGNEYGAFRVYYNLGASHVDYTTPSTNGGGHLVGAMALLNNEFWVWVAGSMDGGPPFVEFAVFDKLTGVRTHDYPTFGNIAAGNIAISNTALTANYLYALGSMSGQSTVWRINRSDGTINATFDLTNISPFFIAVASDNLIYVAVQNPPSSSFALYYIQNFTDLVYIGKMAGLLGGNPFGVGTAQWINGTFYWGSAGFSGFDINLYKIRVACPPEGVPVVASISTDATTVGGSDTVNVTWSNILLPDTQDGIDLYADVPGQLGFTGTPIAHLSTAGLGGATAPFTLPGVSAGNYFFALTTQVEKTLIAKSNVFTVS